MKYHRYPWTPLILWTLMSCLCSLGWTAADDAFPPASSEEPFGTHLAELERWADGQEGKMAEDLATHLDLLELELRRQAPSSEDVLLDRIRTLRSSLVESHGAVADMSTVESLQTRPNELRTRRFQGEWPLAEVRGHKTAPTNNTCESALPIGLGVMSVDLSQATQTGNSSCDGFETSRDLWFRWTPQDDGRVVVYSPQFFGDDVTLSAYRSCPGSALNELTCAGDQGLLLDVEAGQELFFRVAGTEFSASSFELTFDLAASISGRVVEVIGQAPALPTSVFLSDEFGRFVREAEVEEDGTYELPVIIPGTHFLTASGDRHERELYDDATCFDPDFCLPDEGDPVAVAPRASLTGIDFDLNVLGRISGRVTDVDTGLPIPFARVLFTEIQGSGGASATTDDDGRFLQEGLQSGDYRVVFSHPEYRDELFGGIHCIGNECRASCLNGCQGPVGTTVGVDLNVHRQSINATLDALGRIRGRATGAASGDPIHLLDVMILDDQGFEVTRAMTQMDGTYEIGGLDPGEYWVRTRVLKLPFVDELYPEVSCPQLQCELTDATAVEVGLRETLGGIDFTLDRGGEIRGRITGTGGGPLCGAVVQLFDEQGAEVDDERAECDGTYGIDGLATGTYFAVGSAIFYQAELYDDIPCTSLSPCEAVTGTPIPVQVASTTAGIDFFLRREGRIRGRVVDAETGMPPSEALVRAWSSDGSFANAREIGADGTYELRGLEAGVYTVSVYSPGYSPLLYPDLPVDCEFFPCDPTVGEPIPIELEQTVEGIDFALSPLPASPLGVIEGTARTELGEPTAANLILYNAEGSFLGSRSFESGVFRWEELDAGIYFLLIGQDFGLRSEIYRDRPCLPEDCDPLSGEPIVVGLGQTTVIDVVVHRLGRIAGTILDGHWGDPLEGAGVWAHDANGESQGFTFSEADGSYLIEGLEPGTYYVTAAKEDFLGRRFPDIPCPFNGCAAAAGTALEVAANVSVDNIDLVLDLQQGVAGTVRDEDSGAPISGVSVQALDAQGSSFFGRTNARGHYLIGLPLGSFRLKTELGFHAYEGTDEVYNGIPCPDNDSCDITIGEPIAVVENQVLTGIDFNLEGSFCQPGFYDLCLNQGRFRAELSYRDVDGLSRRALTRELTDDSGTFYFFDQDNIEVMVKVIDACVDPFNTFWVFHTGLTNLETTLTVTDTFTGQERIYSNSPGTPYELVTDTSAFATCDFEGAGQTEGVSLALRDIASNWTAATSLDKTGGACDPSSTAACLLQSRFRVEATWRDAQGGSGTAQAVQLTPDTGYFWFFAEDNVEVLVKALDACNLNPFNSFWLFAAGLTDVEVSLTVTDTESGAVRIYTNPLGSPFQPIQDTEAFLSCP